MLRPNDIVFLLSTADADGDARPRGALGGLCSETPVSKQARGNLFADITGQENEARAVEYRCVFVYNANPSASLIDARAFLHSVNAEGAAIAIGADPAKAAARSAARAQRIPDARTAPQGVAFSDPITRAGGVLLGDLGPGEARAIWVRRSARASRALDADGFVLRVDGDSTE